jgi:hypothetical protein
LSENKAKTALKSIISRVSTCKAFEKLFGVHVTTLRYMASDDLAPKHFKKMTKIGTHSGTFHCDEVLACFMLKQLAEYKDAEIIRTRDENELAQCDIVVDVGGVYDPVTHRYDHHQRNFTDNEQSECCATLDDQTEQCWSSLSSFWSSSAW